MVQSLCCQLSAMDWIRSPLEVPIPTHREVIASEEPPLGPLGRTRVEVASRMKESSETGPVLKAGPMAAFTPVAPRAARAARTWVRVYILIELCVVDVSRCGSSCGLVVLVDGLRGQGAFLYVLNNDEAAFNFPSLLLPLSSVTINVYCLMFRGNIHQWVSVPGSIALVEGVLALVPSIARMGCADTNMLPPC